MSAGWRSFVAVGLAGVALASCASPPPAPKAPAADPAAAFMTDMKPLRYHSARFELSVPFPDGHAWRIDDHHAAQLVATHASTEASVTLELWGEHDLMNRQRCEESARTRGLVKDADLQTVADEIIVGPGQYDSHVVIAALPSTAPHQTIAGHAFLFGAHLRKCLFVHYETRERAGEDEASLSARLAVARLQILGGISLDPFDALPVQAR